MSSLSKGEATRRRILHEAIAIFGDRGLSAASLRQIAAAAALTEPALYRHFADKNALYRAALREAANLLELCIAGTWRETPTVNGLPEVVGNLMQLMMANSGLAGMTQQLLVAENSELSLRLFNQWAQLGRDLQLNDSPPGNNALVLLNLLGQITVFEQSRSGLVEYWGQDYFDNSILPAQREQLRALLRNWMLH